MVSAYGRWIEEAHWAALAMSVAAAVSGIASACATQALSAVARLLKETGPFGGQLGIMFLGEHDDTTEGSCILFVHPLRASSSCILFVHPLSASSSIFVIDSRRFPFVLVISRFLCPMRVCSPGPMLVCSPGPMLVCSPGPMLVCSPGPMLVCSPGPMLVCSPGPMLVCSPGPMLVCSPGPMLVCSPLSYACMFPSVLCLYVPLVPCSLACLFMRLFALPTLSALFLQMSRALVRILL
jgi:hypothetical protein